MVKTKQTTLNREHVILIIIFLQSFIIRFLIIRNTIMYHSDPYYYMVVSQDVLEGKLNKIFMFRDRIPFLVLITLGSYIAEVTGNSCIFVNRAIIAIISSLGVLFTYLLAKRLLGFVGGLISAFILSVSPWYLLYSIVPYPDTLRYLMGIITVYIFMFYDSNSYYLFGAIFFALSCATMPASIILLLSIVIIIFSREKSLKKALRGLIPTLIIAFLFFALYMIFKPITRFTLIEQIALFNIELLRVAVLIQLPQQLTTEVFIFSLLGMLSSILSRCETVENNRKYLIALMVYIWMSIFVQVLYYSPYTYFSVNRPAALPPTVRLPPRSLIYIHGFIIIFCSLALLQIFDTIKAAKTKSLGIACRRKKSFKIFILAFCLLLIVMSSFKICYHYTSNISDIEQRYVLLTNWLLQNLNPEEKAIVSYAWKIIALSNFKLSETQIIDFSYAPQEAEDFIYFLATRTDIKYVVFDDLWYPSKKIFSKISANTKSQIFNPVFVYKYRTRLIVYENLLRYHNVSLIIPNSGFEKQNIWHYYYFPSHQGKIVLSFDTQIAKEGNQSLKLTCKWGFVNAYIEPRQYIIYNPTYQAGPYHLIPVIPSAWYRVRFWVKGQNFKGTILFSPVFFNSTKGYVYEIKGLDQPSPQGNFSWIQLSYTFNVINALYLLPRLWVENFSQGILWIDSIELEFAKVCNINGAQWSTDAITDGYALSFNGKDNYASISDLIVPLPQRNLTIELWFKKRSIQNDYAFLIAKDPSLRIGFDPNSLNIRYWIRRCNKWFSYYSYTTVKLNEWYHVVLVIKGTHMQGYINGRPDGDGIDIPDIDNDNIPGFRWGIGAKFYGVWCFFFNGTIDEVRIYNRALSDTEIIYSYNNHKPLNTTGLVLWLPFYEGKGSITKEPIPMCNSSGDSHANTCKNYSYSTHTFLKKINRMSDKEILRYTNAIQVSQKRELSVVDTKLLLCV